MASILFKKKDFQATWGGAFADGNFSACAVDGKREVLYSLSHWADKLRAFCKIKTPQMIHALVSKLLLATADLLGKPSIVMMTYEAPKAQNHPDQHRMHSRPWGGWLGRPLPSDHVPNIPLTGPQRRLE